MGKICKLILTVLICTGATFAQALSVGDIVVETALNQPLKASIGLRNTGTAETEDIVVTLAKPIDFEIADIEYLGFLNDLRFNVVAVGSSSAKILVTSRQAIREPYVNFLVAVTWPNGQVLKEYTILLDPVFGDTSLSSNAGSVAQQVEEAVAPSTRYAARKAPAPAPRVNRLTRSNDTASSVTVLPEDTLWNIAKRVTPAGVSVHQVMHAIKQANPNAFINNNVNGLKAGYQLAIPSANELQAISPQQAISATRRDTALWSGGGDAIVDRSSAVSTRPAGELQLAAADDDAVAQSEQLDALSSENDDLLGRVGSLEEQVDDLNRLLELKNKQLALLQQQAQDGAEASELAALEAEISDADSLVQADDSDVGISDLVEATDSTTENDAVAPEDTVDAPSAEASVATLAANQPLKSTLPKSFEPSLEWWQQAPIQLASLGGASLLLLGVLWLRRGREEEVFLVEDEDVILDADAAVDDEDYIPLPDDEGEAAGDDAFDELESLSEQFKSQDYDVAMAGLEAKVEAEAHRADLRLLLLQKSSEADDKERFVEHYRYLEAIAKPEDLQTAERILTASQGSTAWLSNEADDGDDFFKEIVHEAELTDEIEALLLASEGEASLDDVDFESLADEASLDEQSLDMPLDEVFSEAEEVTADAGEASESVDADSSVDFEETVILTADDTATDTVDEPLEDDSLDFDFDLGDDSDSNKSSSIEAESETEDALDFESTIALDVSQEDPTADEAESSASGDADDELDLDLDFEDFSFGDDGPELDTEGASEASDVVQELDETDLAFDLDDLEGLDDLGDADIEAGELDVDEHIELDLDSEAELLVDEGIVGDREEDDEVFEIGDEDDADIDLELNKGSDDTDDFGDFSGFLDGADEASIADEDEVATKLELGEAFIEMGDIDGAHEILAEVLEEGDVVQQAAARELLDKLDS